MINNPDYKGLQVHRVASSVPLLRADHPQDEGGATRGQTP